MLREISITILRSQTNQSMDHTHEWCTFILQNINSQGNRCNNCYTSKFPNYCSTRPTSTFRQNCVKLFQIQTSCTYVIIIPTCSLTSKYFALIIIHNQKFSRTHLQLFFILHISHLQFDKSKIYMRKNCMKSFQSQTS